MVRSGLVLSGYLRPDQFLDHPTVIKRQIQLLVVHSYIFNWFPIQLEAVDDELDEIGILLVSTPDEEVAQEHGEDT